MAARMLASLRAMISSMAATSVVAAVALGQLDQAQLADAQRAALRAQVAEHLVGRARVGAR